MGQLQSIVHRRRTLQLESFPDLTNFPPEVAVCVLSHLNATDLCLAACVWKHLADNELLWQRLVVELLYQLFVLYFGRRVRASTGFHEGCLIYTKIFPLILACSASRRLWSPILISSFLYFAILLNEKFSGTCCKQVKLYSNIVFTLRFPKIHW